MLQSDNLATGMMVAKGLTVAAQCGHAECVTAILTSRWWRRHSLQDWQQYKRMTCAALHYAANVPTIEVFLQQINDTPFAVGWRLMPAGITLLHSAVKQRRPVQVICKLLKLGADPLAKAVNGQTPADLARASGQTLIAQLLDRATQDTQQQPSRASSSTTA